MLMALILTSHSSLLTTTPRSKLTLKSPKLTLLTVFAKKAGSLPFFGPGKPIDGSEQGEAQNSTNSNPFRLDFGKLPDVKSLFPPVGTSSSTSTGLALSRRRKDPSTVFVAGATGQAGIRILQKLLRQGFSVRAGVPDLNAAQEIARLAATYKIISNEESRRLNAVESTFQNAESISKAIGNASKVIVTIGPAENGATSEVTTSDALQVIKAAQMAGVGHVAIVYDATLTTNSTYNVLDGITSFFGNLFPQSQPLTIPEFLQKVVETDVNYTLIKTKLTEDFSPESSHNIVVSAEGSVGAKYNKVAKSQLASLVADVFSNTAVAENKVVEVFTDPSASSKRVDEFFSAIPVDGRRKAYAKALVKAKAEEEAVRAAEKAREATEKARKIEQEEKKLEKEESRAASLAEEAQEKAAAAGVSVESFLNKAKDLGTGFSWETFSTQFAPATPKIEDKPKPDEKPKPNAENILDRAKDLGSGFSWQKFSSRLAIPKPDEPSKVQIATVRGQAKARTLPAQRAIVKQSTQKPKEVPKPKSKQTESKTEVKKIFGGLFQQETIYVDDD